MKQTRSWKRSSQSHWFSEKYPRVLLSEISYNFFDIFLTDTTLGQVQRTKESVHRFSTVERVLNK